VSPPDPHGNHCVATWIHMMSNTWLPKLHGI